MIIVLGGQKGGSGKSTLATNICASLAIRDSNGVQNDVCLVDADRQLTAGSWAESREENPKLPSIASIQKYGPMASTLKDLNKRYQYVVVDTAGRDSEELRSSLLAADVAIFPFRPSQADLFTSDSVEKLIGGALDINDKLKAYGILSISPTTANASEIVGAKTYFDDLSIPLLDAIIFDRKAYRDAFIEGKGVEEWTDKKAAGEMSVLIKIILDNLGK